MHFDVVNNGFVDCAAGCNAFQALSGYQKEVPPGAYLVDDVVRRFDVGVLGNGIFRDEGRLTWVHGNRSRDTILHHSRTINTVGVAANDVSPVIRTQMKITYNVADPVDNSLWMRVVGPYHEVIGSGTIVEGIDGDVGNFTTFGTIADKRFSGLLGMTAITGRVYHAKESEVPGINTHGASKSLAIVFLSNFARNMAQAATCWGWKPIAFGMPLKTPQLRTKTTTAMLPPALRSGITARQRVSSLRSRHAS